MDPTGILEVLSFNSVIRLPPVFPEEKIPTRRKISRSFQWAPGKMELLYGAPILYMAYKWVFP